ncbi:ABC transporter permease [Legionella cincinnatiensis]|uniref:ABC exporter transmembrane subunit, DevC protein n=1 Tax=Legionella cincinnatiensis TaxID=28085 RepID=A0A378INJ4_9GAMM|nr:FtsX-like permease family protein [Legionella cincinnatiensis]KTC93478.1 FtsX-like permease family protein [Legionella cincinnatiensis]STX36520.1 ABC exporter transmembrane subunit, DevC protein [Legionella cincinnatiensis]
MIGKIARSLIDAKHINLFSVAFKMLVNSKRKFIGMVIGATFSAFIIMQQPGIYQGVTDRIVAPIRAITDVDLWVMGDTSFSFADPLYFRPIDIYRIRSIPGVLWAKQLYRTWYTMIHSGTGKITSWELIGVDPESLVGLPKTMIAGTRSSIHKTNSIIIDGYALKQFEAPDGRTIQLGEKMLEGRNKLIVTGITKPLRTYMYEPKAYMTSNHIPDVSHRNSFILVKVKPTYNVQQIAYEIRKTTGFLPLTPDQFVERSNQFFREKTPIVIAFIAVAIVGFIIGLVMMWQIFTNFVLTHLHQFGMLKMLGVSSASLIKMVLFQAAITGGLGYILGLALTMLFGVLFHDTTVAFHLTQQIILLGALGSTIVIVFSSYFAILKVLRLDTIELCRDTN